MSGVSFVPVFTAVHSRHAQIGSWQWMHEAAQPSTINESWQRVHHARTGFHGGT